MKAILAMLVGACLMAGARAQTFAEVVLTHVQQFAVTDAGNVILRDENLDSRLRVDRDGEAAGGVSVGVGVNPGQTVFTVFDYTITLSNRGLPYPGPRTIYCTPIAFESQCVEPFGAEGTFAEILVGFRDPRGANPFIDMSRDDVTLTVAGSAGGQLVQSGQLTSVVTTSSESGAEATVSALVFVNVFAAAIPEASTWASMLAGISLLAVALARGACHGRRSGLAAA